MKKKLTSALGYFIVPTQRHWNIKMIKKIEAKAKEIEPMRMGKLKKKETKMVNLHPPTPGALDELFVGYD